MQQAIDITENDIEYAEKILLAEGQHFDDERRTFIENLEVIDLQAVPGSGKTTALLAKLLILERKLPFVDNSGILILSHTNVAIDEIKHKIELFCPKLFRYPNFIGTIQSFVDEFLAIPYYTTICKKKPIRIDNEVYDEVMKKEYSKLEYKAKCWINRKNDPENLFKNLRFDIDSNLVDKITGEVLLKSKNRSTTYTEIAKIKRNVLEKGILHFDDAYFLANRYLQKYPQIKNIIQQRFSYVFVDEMQDMETHQYDLLEKLFYDDRNSTSIFQRIGDKNQSIYSSVKSYCIWKDRQEVLSLTKSYRLSSYIANVVKNFALYQEQGFKIEGINQSDIKPHIILYKDNQIKNVIPYFAMLVKDLKDKGRLSDYDKGINVVSWNTVWEKDVQDVKKVRLIDYYNQYRKEENKSKQDYISLKDYLLFYDKTKSSFASLRKNILNAFLRILRIEDIGLFTKRTLLNQLKEESSDLYNDIKLNVYKWVSKVIIEDKLDEALEDIRSYIPQFVEKVFNKQINLSREFINSDKKSSLSSQTIRIKEEFNHYKYEDIEIEIGSVHSVKGQTHCATLYLESYFNKSYESKRLKDAFLGDSIQSSDEVLQSLKMVYVGFSRPTNLLCVAIHKDRFDRYLSEINKDIWEIKEIN